MAKSSSAKRFSGAIDSLKYEELVEVVRSKSKGNDAKKNKAYNEIEKRIKPKILYIVRQFYIPGFNFDDILQEA